MKPQPHVPKSDAPVKRPLVVVLVLGFSSLCAAMMQSLVIPIQSDLPRLLDTSASNTSWVVTATLLGGAVSMPIAGRLADIFGKKPILIGTAVALLLGSLLCAVTDVFSLILAGRVLQGMSMGYIPVAISMVREVTPAHMTNTALAAVSAALGVGGALGLPIAAFIVQSMDWRALFWLSGTLAVVVIVLSATILPHRHRDDPAKIDVVGAIGLTFGLVSVLVGVTKGNDWGWANLATLSLIVGGVIILLAWGVYELRQDMPIVDLRTTARLPVLFTNLAALMAGFGMMAQSVVVPQLMQMPSETGFGLELSILETGLWMAPAGLMMLVMSPVSSALLTHLGGRLTLALGSGVLGAGYLLAIFMTDAPWKLMIATSVACAGVGIAYAAMPALILDNVPKHEASSSVGVNALMRSIGTTVSGAVMAIVLTSQRVPTSTGINVPSHESFQLGFLIAAGAAIAAVVLTLLVPRKQPTQPAASQQSVTIEA